MTSLVRSFLAAALVLFGGNALAETIVGSGRMVTESRPVAGFAGLSVAVSGKVTLTQGNTESLTITADDNVLPYIESSIEKNQLRIRFKPPAEHHLTLSRETIAIAVVAKNVESINVGGSADVTVGPFRATRFVANIGGSGTIDIASAELEDMVITIGGSGDFKVRGGRTDTLDVRIGGSGEVNLAKMQSKRAKVRIGGSGEASLWVRETLSARVAGSGGVRYYGDPTVDRSVSGSGDVRRAGAAPT